MVSSFRPHRVVAVVFDDFQSLDLTGPFEVLRVATRLGVEPTYEVLLASPEGTQVRSESGLRLAVDMSLEEACLSNEPIDTLVVVGGEGVGAFIADRAALDWVVRLGERASRVTSVCTGALVLAAAGLLDGYEATTHWFACDRLAEYPGVRVHPDRIYVRDRNRWTSAGITAGIDLFLAIVDTDHGPVLAHQAATWLVVFSQRPGGQSQFSVQLQTRPAHTPAIAGLQRWLPGHLREDLTVERLAAQAGVSERTLARLFRAETGATPAAYVEQLRVEEARRLLEATDLTVAAVAAAVGLRHAETLHRAFRRRLGTTPDRYRQHFARSA